MSNTTTFFPLPTITRSRTNHRTAFPLPTIILSKTNRLVTARSTSVSRTRSIVTDFNWLGGGVTNPVAGFGVGPIRLPVVEIIDPTGATVYARLIAHRLASGRLSLQWEPPSGVTQVKIRLASNGAAATSGKLIYLSKPKFELSPIMTPYSKGPATSYEGKIRSVEVVTPKLTLDTGSPTTSPYCVPVSGVPVFTAPPGTIAIRYDGGATAGNRIYVSQGGGTWIPIASV